MTNTSDQLQPPKPVARAFFTFGICLSPALPIICQAASATLISAVAPIGLVATTPPYVLMGIMPSMCVAPLRISLGPWPL